MERLNHHHLFIFWTLARKGSFTRAAESLHIAQSAVTSQIRNLEETLGITLVDRLNKRRPALTDAGKKILEYADSIFETSQELMNWAKSGEPTKMQHLRIGAISGLSRNLQYEFLQSVVGNPNVRIEVTTGDQEKLVRLLAEHSLDIILSSHNVKAEGRSAFHSHILTSSEVVFVARKKGQKTKTSLHDYLANHQTYIPGKNFEARPELDALLERIPRLSIAGEIDDIALLRVFAVRSGAVVAIPALGVKTEIENKELKLIGRTGIYQRFYAITRHRKHPSALVENLISSLQKKRAAD